jgi:hypothetical protein
MQLSQTQFAHLNELKNLANSINFAVPKPKATYSEMVREIRRKKSEQRKRSEEERKEKE